MPLNEEYLQIGQDIIGAAFAVRKHAGKGFREKYYERALCYEISLRGHEAQQQVTIPAVYRGLVIDDAYQADIVVDNKVIIEVKAIVTMSEPECRQLLTYLKLSDYHLGYLINFGARDFCIGNPRELLPYRKGIYRFVNKI